MTSTVSWPTTKHQIKSIPGPRDPATGDFDSSDIVFVNCDGTEQKVFTVDHAISGKFVQAVKCTCCQSTFEATFIPAEVN